MAMVWFYVFGPIVLIFVFAILGHYSEQEKKIKATQILYDISEQEARQLIQKENLARSLAIQQADRNGLSQDWANSSWFESVNRERQIKREEFIQTTAADILRKTAKRTPSRPAPQGGVYGSAAFATAEEIDALGNFGS